MRELCVVAQSQWDVRAIVWIENRTVQPEWLSGEWYGSKKWWCWESKYVDAINKNIQLERRATWVGIYLVLFGTCITQMSAEVACP